MRDVKTNAIVNTDSTAYVRYMNDKNARLSQKDEIDRLKDEIELLKPHKQLSEMAVQSKLPKLDLKNEQLSEINIPYMTPK